MKAFLCPYSKRVPFTLTNTIKYKTCTKIVLNFTEADKVDAIQDFEISVSELIFVKLLLKAKEYNWLQQ